MSNDDQTPGVTPEEQPIAAELAGETPGAAVERDPLGVLPDAGTGAELLDPTDEAFGRGEEEEVEDEDEALPP